MKYLLKYQMESKYLHFVKEYEKEFKTIYQVRDFLILNIKKIGNYRIYKLTDLSSK